MSDTPCRPAPTVRHPDDRTRGLLYPDGPRADADGSRRSTPPAAERWPDLAAEVRTRLGLPNADDLDLIEEVIRLTGLLPRPAAGVELRPTCAGGRTTYTPGRHPTRWRMRCTSTGRQATARTVPADYSPN